MSRIAQYILLLKQQPQTLEVKKEIQNLQQQFDIKEEKKYPEGSLLNNLTPSDYQLDN
jgi:hypothetical protein